jgi:hypothetical protein
VVLGQHDPFRTLTKASGRADARRVVPLGSSDPGGTSFLRIDTGSNPYTKERRCAMLQIPMYIIGIGMLLIAEVAFFVDLFKKKD